MGRQAPCIPDFPALQFVWWLKQNQGLIFFPLWQWDSGAEVCQFITSTLFAIKLLEGNNSPSNASPSASIYWQVPLKSAVLRLVYAVSQHEHPTCLLQHSRIFKLFVEGCINSPSMQPCSLSIDIGDAVFFLSVSLRKLHSLTNVSHIRSIRLPSDVAKAVLAWLFYWFARLCQRHNLMRKLKLPHTSKFLVLKHLQ